MTPTVREPSSEPTPLAAIVETWRAVGSTRSRNAKVEALARLLETVSPEEVETVVAVLSGEPRQGKVGVGYASVFSVEVAPTAEPELTVADLDRLIDRVQAAVGAGSQAVRAGLLGDLMTRATASEQAFVRRLLTGELRQGALEGIMHEAVARAAGVPAQAVRRATMLGGSLGRVAQIALGQGLEALEAVGLEVLSPVRPMLAHTAADLDEALAALGRAVVEWKLDGARIQVHRLGGEVRVFTRNQNDVTARVREVVEAALRLPTTRVVLDGEAMTVDDAGLPRPFQETMSRFGADLPAADLPVLPFFFDILHADGDDLIDRPLEERLARLDEVVPARSRIPRIVTDDRAEASAFLAEARERLHEGVMVKALDSAYEAGRRGRAWLKVKPAHTLDLVILAAEWGHGRRTGKLSNLHLGARDPEGGGYVMLGKTFKGLTDEMLAWQTNRLLELEESRQGGVVFVRPELVAEVAFDGVLPSPRYPGGMALRFARVKGYRPDKGPEEADTIDTVREIFQGRR